MLVNVLVDESLISLMKTFFCAGADFVFLGEVFCQFEMPDRPRILASAVAEKISCRQCK